MFTTSLLKKWTLKFKLLYLLNHMRYFNKICRICGMNPRLLTLQISFGEYICYRSKDIEFFLGVYFLASPVITSVAILNLLRTTHEVAGVV